MKLAVLATAALLALPATASAATKVYGGTAGETGEIAMDVKVNKRGKPKMITEIRAAKLPAECEQSGQLNVSTRTPPLKLKINNKGKFYGELVQPTYGNKSWIRGKFTSKRQVTGTFVYDYHFLADDQYPEENCRTAELPFTMSKGGPDVVIPPPSR
jgi:hypothetical protein